MAQKRSENRTHLSSNLEVYHRDTNELIGKVIDLTPAGMRLLCKRPMTPREGLQLRMTLPAGSRLGNEITFEANSRWCTRDINPDYYTMGLELADLSNDDEIALDRLIEVESLQDWSRIPSY
ncbi:MAG: PilZ domain-containing protein [candidate division Zixibacteria bacterium]|nr:PilZ domain-containing protein [candidate division Zixibacteria bacterium]